MVVEYTGKEITVTLQTVISQQISVLETPMEGQYMLKGIT